MCVLCDDVHMAANIEAVAAHPPFPPGTNVVSCWLAGLRNIFPEGGDGRCGLGPSTLDHGGKGGNIVCVVMPTETLDLTCEISSVTSCQPHYKALCVLPDV